MTTGTKVRFCGDIMEATIMLDFSAVSEFVKALGLNYRAKAPRACGSCDGAIPVGAYYRGGNGAAPRCADCLQGYIHPFEKAGLGKAPFTYLGIEIKVGPIRTTTAGGCMLEIGSPGQPMGCCKYCGQGIAECHVVRSSDGNVFDVGCDCIRKVAAKGSKIRTEAERASNDRKNAARRERESVRRAKADAAARERLSALLGQLGRVRPALAAEPHPCIPGKTLADYVDYCVEAGIATGRVIEILEKAAA